MARFFQGNAPHGAFLMEMSSDAAWALYRRNTDGKFANFKLISMGPRERKANFWLGFHIESGKLVQSNDSRTLEQYYAGVYEWVIETLRRYYAKR